VRKGCELEGGRIFDLEGEFWLSPLFAQRSTTDRRKSFISTYIAKQGGVGGTSFFENELWEVWVGDGYG
jgi:hypothetical protein